ncbi:MAG: hypothetical protein OK442_00580 [Thaumarchaeota archaeon]|nr:hypothetical protein [Nitrososphaerota archaeon]
MAVIIIIIISTAAATGATIYYSRNGSFPGVNFPSPSSTANNSTQTSSAQTTTSENSDYLIQISGVQPDTQGGCGASQQSTCYVFTVTATYTGNASWTVFQQDFELATQTGQVVQISDSLPQGDQPFAPATLLSGQHAAGQLEFALPVGQAPGTLDYVDQSIGLSEEVPTPMSQPTAAGHVEVTAQDLIAFTLAEGSDSATPTCATGSSANSITLTNTGSAASSAASFSITYDGRAFEFPITGACNIAAGGRVVITMAPTDLVTDAAPGQPYTGAITLANGEHIIFTGTFQSPPVGQGAQVAVTGTDLVGATLAGGSNSATPTCATGSAANSILLVNTGDAPASATSMSITYSGAVYNFPITGACTVTAAGVFGGNPLYITMAATDLVTGAVSGASFTGTVTMSNGVILVFAGTFQ